MTGPPRAGASVLSLGVAVAVLGALLMPQTSTAPGGAPTAYVSVDRTKPLMNSRLGVGTTLTQETLQPWGNGAAESSGAAVLQGSVQLSTCGPGVPADRHGAQ